MENRKEVFPWDYLLSLLLLAAMIGIAVVGAVRHFPTHTAHPFSAADSQ